jgi:putative nucleotidyltransferase with HDIG domain
MMKPPLAKWYLGTVMALGLAVVLQVPFAFDSSFPPRFVLFFVLTSLGSCCKLRLPGVEGSLSIRFFFVLLAVPQLSLGEAVAISAFGALVELLWGEKSVPRATDALTNISISALATLLTWDVFHSVMWGPLFEYPMRMSASACIYFMAVTWPVSAGTAVNTGKRIIDIWRNTCRWTFPYYLLGAALAGASNWSMHTTTGQAVFVGLGALFLLYRAYNRYLVLLESERNRAQADRQHAEETSRLHLRTIQALALAIEAKDAGTTAHLNRLRIYTEAIGQDLGMSVEELDALKAATLLHDVGKLAVPEHILSKPGSLTPEEFEKMKIHTVVGAEIVESVAFPYPVAPIVRGHHEHWDGSGYPDRIRGEEIPFDEGSSRLHPGTIRAPL